MPRFAVFTTVFLVFTCYCSDLTSACTLSSHKHLSLQEIKSLKHQLQASESKVEELEALVKESEEANSSHAVPLIDLDSSLSMPETSPSIDFNSPMPSDTKEVS